MKKEIKLPEWWYFANKNEAKILHEELQKELPEKHILFGENLQVFAHRDGATDDILCFYKENPQKFVVIHLTWSWHREFYDDFPTIEFHGSFEEFLKYEENF